MALNPLLLEILVCPKDKGSLLYFEDESFFYNPRLQRKYPIEDGLPHLIFESSIETDDAEHARLMKRAESEDVVRTWKDGNDRG